jgi:ankyrin repeat protein
MVFRKFIPPMSIIIFLILTLGGTYFVRLRILDKHMASAMEMGDRAKVAELANSFPCPVNARDKDTRTPLHCAAAWRDRALAELLLRKGADVNARTAAGATPLHGGEKEIAEFLIARGADVNARDKDGKTPLHVAAGNGRTAVVELLIAKGADINAKTTGPLPSGCFVFPCKETPLHRAVQQGWTEVAELLIAKGADVNAKDKDGKTALQRAIDFKHDDIADALRKAGAKE